MKTYYLVKGEVTDAAAYHENGHVGVNTGDTEWQFSDGVAGDRTESRDFLTIEDGLRELSPCIIHWDVDNDRKAAPVAEPEPRKKGHGMSDRIISQTSGTMTFVSEADKTMTDDNGPTHLDDLMDVVRSNVSDQYPCITDREGDLLDGITLTAKQARAWSEIDRKLAEHLKTNEWGYAADNWFVAYAERDPDLVGILLEFEFTDDFEPPPEQWDALASLVPVWADFDGVPMGTDFMFNARAAMRVFFPFGTKDGYCAEFNLHEIEACAEAITENLYPKPAEPEPEPASWSRDTNISYNGVPVVGLFLWSDINSPDNPNDMKDDRRYYEFRNEPYFFMGAMQLRDLIDNMLWVDERVGAPQFHIYLELKGQHDLVKMDDYNLFTD